MQQYFIDQQLTLNQTIHLDQEIQFHLRNVLKSKPYTTIRIVDYRGVGFFGVVDQKMETALLTKTIDQPIDCEVDITLIMALIKREKLELVIAKATELGVKKIILLESSRCVVNFSKKDVEKKLLRFATIAKEAAEVSHRLTIPKIMGPIPINQLKDVKSNKKILLYEKTDASKALPKIENGSSVSIVVGPEGGFSEEEVTAIESHGFEQASLTHRILRAETAAIMACSILGGTYG